MLKLSLIVFASGSIYSITILFTISFGSISFNRASILSNGLFITQIAMSAAAATLESYRFGIVTFRWRRKHGPVETLTWKTVFETEEIGLEMSKNKYRKLHMIGDMRISEILPTVSLYPVSDPATLEPLDAFGVINAEVDLLINAAGEEVDELGPFKASKDWKERAKEVDKQILDQAQKYQAQILDQAQK